MKRECTAVWFVLVFQKLEGLPRAVAEFKLPVCIDLTLVLCSFCFSAAPVKTALSLNSDMVSLSTLNAKHKFQRIRNI